MLKVDIEKARQ